VSEPNAQILHDSGIEIRYWDGEEKGEKRRYEVRGQKGLHYGGYEYPDWREVPSVTTVTKILHKENLISWAQRIGADGMIQLFNMGVIQPVMFEGQQVLGAHLKDMGLVVLGEDQALELLGKYKLNTNAKMNAGGKRGLACHKALEIWAETGEIPNPAHYPITEQGYIVALEAFLKESGAVAVRSEVMVASLKHGYAGRFDLDIELPKSVELQTHHTPKGRGDKREWFEAGLYRVDLKTTKDVYEEHGEQLEAYETACVECGLPSSLQRVVLHTNAESRYKFKPSWSTFEDFEATLHKWRLIQARKERK
jgi:hypothetical protein